MDRTLFVGDGSRPRPAMNLHRFWRNSGAIGSNVGLDDEHPGGSLADRDPIQQEVRGRRQSGHG
jgi:hypothetical protein